MIGGLLVYLMVVDLSSLPESELRAILEALLLEPVERESASLAELRARVAKQLDATTLDRDELAAWGEEYLELLPPTMDGLEEAFQRFDALLDELGVDEMESPRLSRFQHAVSLLRKQPEKAEKVEAARLLEALEDDVTQARQSYNQKPPSLVEISPGSLVSHRHLLEGLDFWRQAFTAVHRGKLDESLELATDGNRLLAAVAHWSREILGEG